MFRTKLLGIICNENDSVQHVLCSCNLEGDNNFGHLLVVRAIYNTP